MSTNQAVLSPPRHGSFSGPQKHLSRQVSVAVLSFEFFTLFVTVGFAPHQLVRSPPAFTGSGRSLAAIFVKGI